MDESKTFKSFMVRVWDLGEIELWRHHLASSCLPLDVSRSLYVYVWWIVGNLPGSSTAITVPPIWLLIIQWRRKMERRWRRRGKMEWNHPKTKSGSTVGWVNRNHINFLQFFHYQRRVTILRGDVSLERSERNGSR